LLRSIAAKSDGMLPRQNFFQNSERLLACINPERETHEILVRD